MSTERHSTSDLLEENASRKFYEERYEAGYMDAWPEDKLRRVTEMLHAARGWLPASGNALDFGCGSGVFTGLMVDALPGWKVYGTDMSENALALAREKHPDITFFSAAEVPAAGKPFDFIFTHHVLEHVFDLDEVIDTINTLAAPSSLMLHILPCGNPGSFEYRLSMLHTNGIDPDIGNRFFYEDEGHVRRLTTADLSASIATAGYRLAHEYYGNQVIGAFNWITRRGPSFVNRLTNTKSATGSLSAWKLAFLKVLLLPASFLRAINRHLCQMKDSANAKLPGYLYSMLAIPTGIMVKATDGVFRVAVDFEWKRRKKDWRGSEMYLFFIRDNNTKSMSSHDTE